MGYRGQQPRSVRPSICRWRHATHRASRRDPHILSLRLGIEICEGDRRAAFFHGQLLQHIDAEAAHPLNPVIDLFFAGSLENQGENAVAVAGEKAGKRVDLSLVRLDEIDGKVAEMADYLAGTNGDRLPAILAGELNVGRFLDVREAERSHAALTWSTSCTTHVTRFID